jgi:hypothetical protein
MTFNERYYVARILKSLHEWKKYQLLKSLESWSHMSIMLTQMGHLVKNALVTDEMKKASHPAYSSGLAPSGFYFFGHVNQVMADQSFLNTRNFFRQLDRFWTALKKSH